MNGTPLLLLALVAAAGPAPARGEDTPPPRPEKRGGPASSPKRPPERPSPPPEAPPASKKPAAAKAGRKEPPRWIKLPEQGDYEAADLLPLAGLLHGRKVVGEGPGIAEVIVRIPAELAGQRAGREELSLLLGAHRIYLFLHEREGEPVLFATRDPHWTPVRDVPRFLRKFQVRSKDFEAVAREVERYLEEKNRAAPPGQPPAGAALDPRTRRIIVRAPTERILAGVDEIVTRLDRPPAGADRLYSFSPRHRPAGELLEEVLEALSEGEAKRVSLVVSRRGNLLLIRAAEDLHRKIQGILHARDLPEPAPERS
jgi:hypothetical protein